MRENINTTEYWNNRFGTGNWEDTGGRNQTRDHMLMILPHLDIEEGFSGTILDFGCALGQAIPILNRAYPRAKLLGLDASENAIDKCRERYSEIAEFIVGDTRAVPQVDIIISAHVMEHITDDLRVVLKLVSLCKDLYIAVPYREDISYMFEEHVNSYTEKYYETIPGYRSFSIARTYPPTLGRLFWELFNIHLKNVAKFFLRRRLSKNYKQIIFHFKSEKS